MMHRDVSAVCTAVARALEWSVGGGGLHSALLADVPRPFAVLPNTTRRPSILVHKMQRSSP